MAEEEEEKVRGTDSKSREGEEIEEEIDGGQAG